ncbi:NosD domain-containing protein [Pelagicoccus sp. SDUM812003]|uniref:NosD domain-containing protein n=1 Tax=Pelagicoccus sp. SDUM812003 TaxID=3041267 RepID=UPI00280E9A39|nr:NosD domain-containing protein [Pelagicoccus sp. SDUM812003]MDQ8202221.1 NosD domain-containing protein [Pelagicoccus sp. SDUM812003]
MRISRTVKAIATLAALFACPLFGASLQERIDAAEADAELLLPAGEYQGPILIEKPLTLRGELGAKLIGNGDSSVLTINANNVTIVSLHISRSGRSLEKDHSAIFVQGNGVFLKGNTIEQSLHGIYLKEAQNCRIEDNVIRGQTTKRVPIDDPIAKGLEAEADGLCTIRIDANQRGNGIHLWNATGNVLKNNTISDTRDGIYFSFSHETRVTGNTIRNVRYGLHYMYSDYNTFENNRFEQNAAGAAIMYSEGLLVRNNTFTNNAGYRAYGVLVQSVDKTAFIGNTISRNTVGLYLENSNDNTLRSNQFQRNYVGVRLSSSSAKNTFTENGFQGNLHPVESDELSSSNRWAANGRGNRWPSSQPVDLDGDGAGELPHRQADLLGPHRRDFPMIGLLSESPFLKLLSFVHARASLPGVPAIEDPAPLVDIARNPPAARTENLVSDVQ